MNQQLRDNIGKFLSNSGEEREGGAIEKE